MPTLINDPPFAGAFRLLKVYKGLTDVVVVKNAEGDIEYYAMVEDPAIDVIEENEIIARIEIAFKVKLIK